MSQTEFRRYILSSEFKQLLQCYEETVASGEHAYFDTDDLIDIAEYYNIKKDIDASVGAAEYCLQQSPGEVLALQLLARTCLTEYKDAGQAQAYIDQLGDDNSAETVLIKAEALLLKDERQQAFDMLAVEYARLQEDAQTGGVDAVGYTDDEEDEEDCQGDVLECFPLDVAMLLCDYDCFGEAERWMGGYSQAPAEMLFEYWETWGRIYHATGRLQQAADALNKAIDDDAYSVVTWIQLCDVQYQMARVDDALQSAQYALALDAGNEDALMYKACCLLEKKQFDEASNVFEKVVSLYPENPRPHILLGAIALEKGDAGEVGRQFTAALEKADYDIMVILDVGQLMFEMGFVDATYRLFRILFEACIQEQNEGGRMTLPPNLVEVLAECSRQLGKQDEYEYYKSFIPQRDDDMPF